MKVVKAWKNYGNEVSFVSAETKVKSEKREKKTTYFLQTRGGGGRTVDWDQFSANEQKINLNGCKKQVTASIITFIGWAGAVGTFFKNFVTDGFITNSYTAKFAAMKYTIIHVLVPVLHLLVPGITPLKGQRKTVIKRSFALSRLCVLLLLSAVLGGQAQQVSLQFYCL